jgi:hypothetical protein
MIEEFMIKDVLSIGVRSLGTGALVTTISKAEEIQTRILLRFVNNEFIWKDL